MRRATIKEFDSLAQKLTSYVGIMDFRFKNLCVKAEPISLLPIEVAVEDEMQKLEECATIAQENEYQFMIIPKYDDDLVSIVKGITMVHPEFKVEGQKKTVDTTDGQGNNIYTEVKYLLVTMPEVNDDRYDVLKNGVDAVYNECKVQMESVNTISKAKFAQLATGEIKEDQDRLDESLKKLNKQWDEQRDKIHQAKLDEIEEAHNRWLAKKLEKAGGGQNSDDANGQQAALSMKIPS